MTTSNAAVDKTVGDKTGDKAGAGKISEKLAEKRRALGRGLESLLPGPRVVTVAPTIPQSPRTDGTPAAASPTSSSAEFLAGAAVATQIDSLQAVASGVAPDGETVFLLEMDQIAQNPYQTRTEFDQNALAELAASIQAQWVLQPIVVRPMTAPLGKFGLTTVGSEVVRSETAWLNAEPVAAAAPEGKERFILILGERRYRASKMAGKTTIPAIVKRVSEQQAAEMTLVENLQRQDLECVDQATAFATLSKKFDMTQEEIGRRVGVSREQVSNYLRLLKLPVEVQNALRSKELSYSHARLLLSLSDQAEVTKVARQVIARKMSVALLEQLVMDSHTAKAPEVERKGGGARWVDPNVRAEQRSLEALLGVRVRIRDRNGKGRIVVEYTTIEDFDRVVRMLKGK